LVSKPAGPTSNNRPSSNYAVTGSLLVTAHARDEPRLNILELQCCLLTTRLFAPLLSEAFEFASAIHDEARCERGASVVLVGDVDPESCMAGESGLLLMHW
jgi:hypothetical protein